MAVTSNDEKRLNNALREFTLSMIPTDDFISKATSLSEKVLRVIQSKSQYPVDRIFYGGSLGKKTSVLYPDIDVIVFINGELPPFKEILDEFEDILLMSDGLRIIPGSIRTTEISIQCTFQGGFLMDLLPAANFVTQMTYGTLGTEDLAKRQRQEVEKRMEMNNYSKYSSSLGESQIFFLRQQSEFTHCLVRLAKFWFKTIFIGERSIYGIKTMIELIAVAIGQEMKNDTSLLTAFRKFLDQVRTIDELQLFFIEERKEWMAIDCKKDRVTAQCRPAGAKGKNFIVEPANVYNNLARNFFDRENELYNLKKFANETQKRLADSNILKLDDARATFEIFRPQPTNLLSHMEKLLKAACHRPQNFLISTVNNDSSAKNPDKKIRNEKIMKNEKLFCIEALQKFLLAGVQSSAANLKKLDMDTVKESVQNVIDEDVCGVPRRSWGPSGYRQYRHEDLDVTFTIPVNKGQESGSVIVSVKWE